MGSKVIEKLRSAHTDRPRMAALGMLAALLIGAQVSSAGSSDPFTIVLIPDSQGYADHKPGGVRSDLYWPNRFNEHVQWIADNVASQNIAFVSHVGDVTQALSPNINSEWTVAANAMNRLHVGNNPANAALVPYSMACGNHDFDNKRWLSPDFGINNNMHYGTSKWISTFGPSRFSGQSWFGGSDMGFSYTYKNTIPGGPDLVRTGVGLSTYQTFQGGGETYLHISLATGAPDGELAWAQTVIDAHPGVKTIVSTHSFLSGNGTKQDVYAAGRYYSEYKSSLGWPNGGRYQIPGNSGQDIWDKFIKVNDEIFMVFCGHTGGQHTRIEQNASGKDVILMLFDRTHRRLSTDGVPGNNRNGAGWLRTLTFDPISGNIHCQTYSTVLDEWGDNVGGDLLGDPTLHPDAYNDDCYDAGGNLINPNGLSDFIITPAGHIVPVPEPASISLLAFGVCLTLLRHRRTQ